MEAAWLESHRSDEQQKDELLEVLWLQSESGASAPDTLLEDPRTRELIDSPRDVLQRAVADGLVREGLSGPELTERGRRRAETIIRRHRLTLRLFHDLLALPGRAAAAPACALEHELSPEATEAICTLLGHPQLDPDGHPIPRGRCCQSATRKVGPVVVRLTELGIGRTGRVCYMTTKFHERYDRLSTFGIVPGAVIRLVQRAPSYVVEVGGSTIALEGDIATEIFVAPRSDGDGEG